MGHLYHGYVSHNQRVDGNIWQHIWTYENDSHFSAVQPPPARSLVPLPQRWYPSNMAGWEISGLAIGK
jgi:hypothetical protein